MSLSGLRMVAMTRHSFSRKYFAVARPNPDEPPVIKTVFIEALCAVVKEDESDRVSVSDLLRYIVQKALV
jgi:hypothetical protein